MAEARKLQTIVHITQPRGPTHLLLTHDRNELLDDLADFACSRKLDAKNFTFSVAGRPIPRGFKVSQLLDEATGLDRPVRMLDISSLRKRLAPKPPTKRKRFEALQDALACTRARLDDARTHYDAAAAKRTGAWLAEQAAQHAVKRARYDVDIATSDMHRLDVQKALALAENTKAFRDVVEFRKEQ